MGLMDFIKGQLIEVIEWTDSSTDTIVYRFPVAGKEIKMGAMLTVRESQVAVFVNEGTLADVFFPGMYELSTSNMPLLTKIKSWKYGFNSPFKAEVYFVNTKQFMDQRWGTQTPVYIKDPEYGNIKVSARGKFSYRVVAAEKFMREFFGTREIAKTKDLEEKFRSDIVQYLKDAVAESKKSLIDLQGELIEMGVQVKQKIAVKFDELGLEIVDLTVEAIVLPEKLDAAFEAGSSINLMGGMETYKTTRTLDALNSAAENKTGVSGMGIGMGAGAALGNVMGQMFNQNPQNQQSVQNQPTVQCPKCSAQIQAGVKFCPNCGQNTAPQGVACVNCNKQISQGTKFCPECGAAQEVKCGKCGASIKGGTKFCPECGNQI